MDLKNKCSRDSLVKLDCYVNKITKCSTFTSAFIILYPHENYNMQSKNKRLHTKIPYLGDLAWNVYRFCVHLQN